MNNAFDDGLTSEQRWLWSVVAFMTTALFPIFAVLYFIAVRGVTSLDERTLALGELFVPLPISIFVSYKIYVTRLQPIVEKIIEVRQKRLLNQNQR